MFWHQMEYPSVSGDIKEENDALYFIGIIFSEKRFFFLKKKQGKSSHRSGVECQGDINGVEACNIYSKVYIGTHGSSAVGVYD